MDETSGVERSDVVLIEKPEEHHSRGRWGVIAAIAAAVVGSVLAVVGIRSARHARTPATMA